MRFVLCFLAFFSFLFSTCCFWSCRDFFCSDHWNKKNQKFFYSLFVIFFSFFSKKENRLPFLTRERSKCKERLLPTFEKIVMESSAFRCFYCFLLVFFTCVFYLCFLLVFFTCVFYLCFLLVFFRVFFVNKKQ